MPCVLLGVSAATSLIGVLLGPILIIWLLLLLPLAVVFLIWLYGARQNAGYLDWRQRWSPAWSIWGWFVLIWFLWFSYQIMINIWRAGQSAPERAKFPTLPAAWWACWCLAWFTGYRHNVVTNYGTSGTGTTVTSSHSLVFGGTVPSLVFAAAAAVLLALIVKQVSAGPVGRVENMSPRRRASREPKPLDPAPAENKSGA